MADSIPLTGSCCSTNLRSLKFASVALPKRDVPYVPILMDLLSDQVLITATGMIHKTPLEYLYEEWILFLIAILL